MTEPKLYAKVATDGAQIAVWRWPAARAHRKRVLLVHGTGFVSQVWQAVAERLVGHCDLYAIDRRGHGQSTKPTAAYHFRDFAEDVCAVTDELGLVGAAGVGHSAGATDLLLAAALRPELFTRIFAMDPTLMDVDAPTSPPSEKTQQIIEATARRRNEFESKAAVLERYRSQPAFSAWQPALLEQYVRLGFESSRQGTVRLRCSPAVEASMLVHIGAAMRGEYDGDGRGNPFASLGAIGCPVRISTTERSADIYKTMAETGRRLIPGATATHFAGAGHAVAQEDPDAVAREVLRFLG